MSGGRAAPAVDTVVAEAAAVTVMAETAAAKKYVRRIDDQEIWFGFDWPKSGHD